MTKERPILFSGPMVRAILAGTKTQTRRIVKGVGNRGVYWTDLIQDTEKVDGKEVSLGFADEYGEWHKTEDYCPYGQPGDRLWVRETWAQHTIEGDTYTVYRADSEPDGDGAPWRPSIFMPRAACRIVLELTAVRVERLQDISEADAQAEGVELLPCTYVGRCQSNSCPRHGRLDRYRLAYKGLWDSLNAKRGYGWDSNPWVWVLTFEQVKQ